MPPVTLYSQAPAIPVTFRKVGNPRVDTILELDPSVFLSEVRASLTHTGAFHFVRRNQALAIKNESSTSIADVLPKLFCGIVPGNPAFKYKDVEYVEVNVRFGDVEAEVLCAAVVFLLPDDFPAITPGFDFIPSCYDIGLPYSKDNYEERLFRYAAYGEKELQAYIWSSQSQMEHKDVPLDSQGRSPLHYAAQNGHVECCRELLMLFTENIIDIQDVGGFTALQLAVLWMRVEVAACLINNGANLYCQPGDSGLESAIQIIRSWKDSNQLKLAKLLYFEKIPDDNALPLAKILILSCIVLKERKVICSKFSGELLQQFVNIPDELGWTLLHYAADAGHMEIVRCLLENGASPSLPCLQGRFPMNVSVRHSNEELLKILLHDSIPDTALAQAVEHTLWKRDVRNMCLLLQHRPTLCCIPKIKTYIILALEENYHLWKPSLEYVEDATGIIHNHILPQAAYYQDVCGVNHLLKKSKTNVNTTDRLGNTPLHYASLVGSDTVANNILASSLVNPNIQNWRGETALHLACRAAQLDVAVTLLEHSRVDGRICDACGRTPLLSALYNHQFQTAECLIRQFGPVLDVSAVDKMGYSVLHYAIFLSKECIQRVQELYNCPQDSKHLSTVVNKVECTYETVSNIENESMHLPGTLPHSQIALPKKLHAVLTARQIRCPVCLCNLCIHKKCRASFQEHMAWSKCSNYMSLEKVQYLYSLHACQDMNDIRRHNRQVLETQEGKVNQEGEVKPTKKFHQKTYFHCVQCGHHLRKVPKSCPRCSNQNQCKEKGFQKVKVKPFQFHDLLKPNRPPSPLHIAVTANDVETFLALYSSPQDLKVTDHHGRTPLELAVQLQHVDLISRISQLDLDIGHGWQSAYQDQGSSRVDLLKQCLLAHGLAKKGDEERYRSKILKKLLERRITSNEMQQDVSEECANKRSILEAEECIRIWKYLDEHFVMSASEVKTISPLAVACLIGDQRCVSVLLEQGSKITDLAALTAAVLQGEPEIMELLLENCSDLPVAMGQFILAQACSSPKRNLHTIKVLVQHCPGLLDQTVIPKSTTHLAKVQIKKQTYEIQDATGNTLLEQLMASSLLCNADCHPRKWCEYEEARETLEDFGCWLIETGLHLGEIQLLDECCHGNCTIIHGMCAALPVALKRKYWRIAQSLLENGAGGVVWKCGTNNMPPSSCQLSLGLSVEELVHLAADREAPDAILRLLLKAGCELLQCGELGPGRFSVDATMLYWILGGKENLVCELEPEKLKMPFTEGNPVDQAVLMSMSAILMFGSDVCDSTLRPVKNRRKQHLPKRVWIRQGILKKDVTSKDFVRHSQRKVLTRQISSETAKLASGKTTSVIKSSLNCRRLSKLLIILEHRPQLAEKLSWSSLRLADQGLVPITRWSCRVIPELDQKQFKQCLDLLHLGQLSHMNHTTMLHEACLQDNFDLVQKIVPCLTSQEMTARVCSWRGCRPAEQDIGATSLELAVWRGHVRMAGFLLDNGATVDYNVLSAACGYLFTSSWSKRVHANGSHDKRVDCISEADRIQLLSLLIERCPGVKDNVDMLSGALFGACWHGYSLILQLLMDKGAAPQAILQRKHRNLLTVAVSGGHGFTTQLMVRVGMETMLPETLLKEVFYKSTLVVMAQQEMWLVVEYIINRFQLENRLDCVAPYLFSRDRDESTLLHYAARHGKTGILQTVLSYIDRLRNQDQSDKQSMCQSEIPKPSGKSWPYCMVDARDYRKRTALWYSLIFKQWDSAKMLLLYDATILASLTCALPGLPSSGRARSNSMSEVSYALTCEKIAHATNSTLLHAACAIGAETIVKELLSYRPYLINCVDAKGRTPLYYATCSGQLSCAKLLIQSGAQVATSPSPVLAAMVSVASANLNISITPPDDSAGTLKDKCKGKKQGMKKSGKAYQPPDSRGHLAMFKRKVTEHVVTLISNEARKDIQIRYMENKNCDQRGHCIEFDLLQLLSSFENSHWIKCGQEGLVVAVTGCLLSMDAQQHLGNLQAAVSSMKMVVPKLGRLKPSIPMELNIVDVMLCFAPGLTSTCSAELFKQSSYQFVKNHSTPSLHPLGIPMACRSGYFDIAEHLLSYISDLQSQCLSTSYVLCAAYASQAGKTEIVKSLVQAGPSHGVMIMMLHISLQFGHNHVAKYFLEEKLIDPLKRFTAEDRKNLEDVGIRGNICPQSGWTALHVACIQGKIELLELIKSLISTSWRRFEDCMPPMMAVELHFLAAAYGCCSVLKWLVDGHSFDLSPVNMMQLDPVGPCQQHCFERDSLLHTAMKNNHEETALYILDQGRLSMHCLGKDNQNMYHIVCLQGHTQLVSAMLELGLEGLDEKDNYGFLPSDYARVMGHIGITDILSTRLAIRAQECCPTDAIQCFGSLRYCLEKAEEISAIIGRKCWSYAKPNVKTGSLVHDLLTTISLGYDALAMSKVKALGRDATVLFSPNKASQNAVHLAAMFGCLATLSQLIQNLKKMEQSIQYEHLNQRDSKSLTPLAYACLRKQQECEDLLRNNGCVMSVEHEDMIKVFYLPAEFPSTACAKDGFTTPDVVEELEKKPKRRRKYLRRKPAKVRYPVLENRKCTPIPDQNNNPPTPDDSEDGNTFPEESDGVMGIYPPPRDERDSLTRLRNQLENVCIPTINRQVLECIGFELAIEIDWRSISQSNENVEALLDALRYEEESMIGLAGLGSTLHQCIYILKDLEKNAGRELYHRVLEEMRKCTKVKIIRDEHPSLEHGEGKQTCGNLGNMGVSEWRFDVRSGVVHCNPKQFTWWNYLHWSALVADCLQINLTGSRLKRAKNLKPKGRIPVLVKWPEILQLVSPERIPSVILGPLRNVVDDIVRNFVEYSNESRNLEQVNLSLVSERGMLFHKVCPESADGVKLTMAVFIQHENERLVWDSDLHNLGKSLLLLEKNDNNTCLKTYNMRKSVERAIKSTKSNINKTLGLDVDVAYQNPMLTCPCHISCSHPVQCWAQTVLPLLKELPLVLENAVVAYLGSLKCPAIRHPLHYRHGSILQTWVKSEFVIAAAEKEWVVLRKKDEKVQLKITHDVVQSDDLITWHSSNDLEEPHDIDSIQWVAVLRNLYRMFHSLQCSDAIAAIPSRIEFVGQKSDEVSQDPGALVVSLNEFAHQPLRNLDFCLPCREGRENFVINEMLPHVPYLEKRLLDMHCMSKRQSVWLDIEWQSFMHHLPSVAISIIWEGLDLFKTALHLFIDKITKKYQHVNSLQLPACQRTIRMLTVLDMMEKTIKKQISVVTLSCSQDVEKCDDGNLSGRWVVHLKQGHSIKLLQVPPGEDSCASKSSMEVEGLHSLLDKMCRTQLASVVKKRAQNFSSAMNEYSNRQDQTIDLCFQEGENVISLDDLEKLSLGTLMSLNLHHKNILHQLSVVLKFLCKNSEQFHKALQQFVHSVCVVMKSSSGGDRFKTIEYSNNVLYFSLDNLAREGGFRRMTFPSWMVRDVFFAVYPGQQGMVDSSLERAVCPAACTLNIDEKTPLLWRSGEKRQLKIQIKNVFDDSLDMLNIADCDTLEHVSVQCKSVIHSTVQSAVLPHVIVSLEVDKVNRPKISFMQITVRGKHIAGSPFQVCILPENQRTHSIPLGGKESFVILHEHTPPQGNCKMFKSCCNTGIRNESTKWKSKPGAFVKTQYPWHRYLQQGWDILLSSPVEIIYYEVPGEENFGGGDRKHNAPRDWGAHVFPIGPGCSTLDFTAKHMGNFKVRARCQSCQQELKMISNTCEKTEELSFKVTQGLLDPRKTRYLSMSGKVLAETLEPHQDVQMKANGSAHFKLQFLTSELHNVTLPDSADMWVGSLYPAGGHVNVIVGEPKKGIVAVKIWGISEAGIYWLTVVDEKCQPVIPVKTVRVEVVPGAVDPSQCRASGAGLHTARSDFQSQTFKVKLIDKHGNHISSVKKCKEHVTLESEPDGDLKYYVRVGDHGVLVVNYTTCALDNMLLHVKINGIPIHGSPFKVEVVRPNFETRFTEFRLQLKILAKTSVGLELSVSRERIFDETMQAFQRCMNLEKQLQHPVDVTFVGERGMDLGGLRREWYQLLSKAIFNPHYALFHPGDKNLYRLNPDSDVQPDHLLMFKFIGTLFGKAVFDGENMAVHFVPSLYKNLLSLPVGLDDLKCEDETLYRNLSQLCDIQSSEELESLCLSFAVDENKFGKQVCVPLKYEGNTIDVTLENREEYIKLYASYILTERVSEQMAAFRSGFTSLIPQRLMKQFSADELENIICGQTEIKVKVLRMHACYEGGLQKQDKLVCWFWEVLKEFDQNLLSKFVQFLTGNSRLPVYMRDWQLRIAESSGSDNRLPTASTCFNLIKLPKYKAKKDMETKLTKAITLGTQGFDLT